MSMTQGHGEISAQDALQREATQDCTAEALRALQESAQQALSLAVAVRFAKNAERADVGSVEATLLETLERAEALAALVDAGRGGRTNYTEAISAISARLRRESGRG